MNHLTSEQRRALAVLARALAGQDVYLAGGVGVAAHLDHRSSRDIDVFTVTADANAFADTLAESADVRISGRAPGTLHLEVCGIPASVIRYNYPLLQEAALIKDVPLPVASTQDLICMKLSAISQRGARRDFWDLHELLVRTNRALDDALRSFRVKFKKEDIGHIVRSLVYFTDAEREPPPMGLTGAHWARIKADFTRWVQAL